VFGSKIIMVKLSKRSLAYAPVLNLYVFLVLVIISLCRQVKQLCGPGNDWAISLYRMELDYHWRFGVY
jgi:hypothetical protein